MKINRIRINKTDSPHKGGAYVWAADNAIQIAKASVMVIDTDLGLQGCGAFTPYVGEITSTAVFDFAASTHTEYQQNATGLMNYSTRSTGIGNAWAGGRNLYAPDDFDLGVTANLKSLGMPVSEYGL